MEAVQITIANEPTIASGKQRVAVSVAAVTAAASVFDTTLNASLGRTLQNTPALAVQQSLIGPGIGTQSNNYSVGATRKLRSGVSVNPALTIARTRDNVSNPTAPMRSDIALNVVFPLLRGSGTTVNTAPERSAQLEFEAEQLSYRHAIATSIKRTASNYWEYVSALQSLAVQRESVQRSQKLLDNARRLAKADEIPAADVLKYEARLSRDRSGVLDQEQAFNQASIDLLQAMGLPQTGAALAAPTDRFPSVAPATINQLLVPMTASSLQAIAARQRADVLASIRNGEYLFKRPDPSYEIALDIFRKTK